MCDIKWMEYFSAVSECENMDLFGELHTYHRVFVGISKQPAGVSHLLLTCGFIKGGFTSLAPLPAEPSSHPSSPSTPVHI